MIKNKKQFNIKETAEQLIPDQLERGGYLIAIVIGILMLVLIGAIYTKLPPSIPLHFTLPWGEARLASKLAILTLPSFALSGVIVNVALGKISTKLSPLLPRVLAVASVIIALMMVVSLFGIIQSLVL